MGSNGGVCMGIEMDRPIERGVCVCAPEEGMGCTNWHDVSACENTMRVKSCARVCMVC